MLDYISSRSLHKAIKMYKVSVKYMLCGCAIALVRIYSIWIKFTAQDNLIAPCPVLMTMIQGSL